MSRSLDWVCAARSDRGGSNGLRGRRGARVTFDLLGPERKAHQAPELSAVVLAPGEMLSEQSTDGFGLEVTLVAGSLGGQQLPGQRSQLAAQPGRGRNRKAPFARPQDA